MKPLRIKLRIHPPVVLHHICRRCVHEEIRIIRYEENLSLCARIIPYIFIIYKDLSGIGLKKSQEQMEQRGLSGAVSSDETGDADFGELCGKLFEVCKPLAEDGNMYTYLGKYGDVITEAPKEESEFSNAEFHYYYGGKEIKVSVGISQANDKMLQLHIGIVK